MAPQVNVWHRGKWYGPSYPDAGDLPGAAPEPSKPAPVSPPAPQQAATPPPTATPPPKAGPGSSRTRWAAYATAQGVTVPAGADRDDIIAALRDAGVAVDQPDD